MKKMTGGMKRKLDSTETDSESKAPKISISFGPAFRKKLKTDQAINAVKEFVEACKERDVISEYTKAGGSAKEMVSLMKQFDGKKDLAVAGTLLSALESIVSKTNTELLMLQKNVEEACEELLCNYQVTLQNMLSSSASTSSYRKTILKLFTGMVNLNHSLAKKLLTLFPINMKTLKILTDSRSSVAANKIRKYFIHYLMSFLVDENNFLINELLQKKGLLTSIIPGLKNDHPKTVLLVLNTLRIKIVENLKISKTLKIHTFNTPILCSLEKLYDYRVSKDDQSENQDLVVSVEQAVKDALHGLLIVLCTSHKRGLSFKDRNPISGKSPNQLIFTLLERIETPWNNMLRAELVTEILKVCPEFVKHVYNNVEQYRQPSVSKNWVNLINFLSQVIEKQEFIAENFDEQQAMHFITTFIFPPVVQKMLRDLNHEFIHPHPIIRFQLISLLISILHEIKYLLKRCREKMFFKSLEMHVDSFLNKNLISSTVLLKAWKCGIDIVNEDETETEENDYQEIPDLDNYILRLVNLLLMYGEMSPLNFNQLRINEDPDLPAVEVQNPELHLKIAHLVFLIFNPKPGQEKFSFMIKKLLECYINEVHYHQDEVLRNVFLSTGFFDGFEEEILIWLRCIKDVATCSVNVISDLMVDTLSVLFKKYKKFMKDLTNISSFKDTDLNISSTGVSILAQEYGNLIEISDEFEPVVMLPVKLSPMVPAFLYVLKNKEGTELKNYLRYVQPFVTSVLVHLLHTQSHCGGLETLIKKYTSIFILPGIQSYINFWNSDSSLDSFDSSALSMDMEEYFYLGLSRKGNLEEIKHVIHKADETVAILIWNMSLFCTVQLHEKKDVEEQTITDLLTIFQLLCEKLRTQKTLCLKLMFTNFKFVNEFTLDGTKKKYNFSRILVKTALNPKNIEEFKSCSKYLSSYRLKFILTILEKLQKKSKLKILCDGFEIDDLIKFLTLSPKTITRLLNKLMHLPASLLVNEKRQKPAQWFNVLKSLLNEASKTFDEPVEQNSLNSLISNINKISEQGVSTNDLEESLVSYLCSFPHHIPLISDDEANNLLVSHQGLSQLAVFLMSYRPTLIPAVQNKLSPIENIDVNVLFNVLNKLDLESVDEEILSEVYQHYLRDLSGLIDNESSYVKENVEIITHIVNKFAARKKCIKVCLAVESTWPDFELNADKCSILKVIFEKANHQQLFVQLLIAKLNKILSSSMEVKWLCDIICSIVDIISDLQFLLEQSLWKDFVKLTLKFGLQTANPVLIRTLKKLCEKSLGLGASSEETSILFQMTISHSEFVNLMLSDLEVKCELVELLLILTKANTSVMSSNHVPLLLGSYKATLKKSDQLIFQLLQFYEENGIRFSDCRPYLWGDAAVTHHSIRTQISVSLKRLPLPNQVLELLDRNIVKNTVRYFPLDRDLKPQGYVEYQYEIYDMSFMLPLMSHLLAPESKVSVQKFTRLGALPLVLCSLASQASDVRLAGYHCLQRFRSHLFGREKEILLWDHFMTALRNGIISSGINAEKFPPRLACIVTSFLAQMSSIISEPLHPLYMPLTNFLLAKPSIDVKTVPHFLILFYSIDEKHKHQQEWILNVIKYGMRYKADWLNSRKCFLFKLLLQYSFSSISNESTNALILDIIKAALRIPECRKYLITKAGFLPWLAQVVDNFSSTHRNLLYSIIEILELLTKTKDSSAVISVILRLLYKMPTLHADNQKLEKVLNILSETYTACETKRIIDEEDIKLIIDISTPLFLESIKYRNCLKYKCNLVISQSGKVDNYLIRILQRFLNE